MKISQFINKTYVAKLLFIKSGNLGKITFSIIYNQKSEVGQCAVGDIEP